MSVETVYPVAEVFYSIQGEGNQTGLPMVFVRLAGCTVGKPYTAQYKQDNGLAIFQNECTSWDGRKFPCDTDYRSHHKMSVAEIINAVRQEGGKCKWVSITGGEPLMHDLEALVNGLHIQGFNIHIETSGTIPLTAELSRTLGMADYVVVSPKFPFDPDYIDCIDEVRLLVDQEFSWDNLSPEIRSPETLDMLNVYISPVNDLKHIEESNMKKCIQIAKDHPEVSISLQLHKILNVR